MVDGTRERQRVWLDHGRQHDTIAWIDDKWHIDWAKTVRDLHGCEDGWQSVGCSEHQEELRGMNFKN